MNARNTDDRMSTAEWIDLFKYSRLRQYFLDMARAITRHAELQEDLYQEAWMAVGESPGGNREEYYQEQGFKAMDRFRKTFMRWNKKERHNTHARINRVGRKFYFKKRARTPL